MKSSEIVQLTNEELVEKIELEKAALSKYKFDHVITPLENPCKIKETRRNVARLLTVLRKRSLTEK